MNYDQLVEYYTEEILGNSTEVEQFISVSDVARLYCLHRKDPEKLVRLLTQQIDIDISNHVDTKARETIHVKTKVRETIHGGHHG